MIKITDKHQDQGKDMVKGVSNQVLKETLYPLNDL